MLRRSRESLDPKSVDAAGGYRIAQRAATLNFCKAIHREPLKIAPKYEQDIFQK